VANLIPLVMKSAVGRAPAVRIFGNDYPTRDGTGIRDYVHVLDLADAHARALDFLARAGRSEIFNLGTGHGASVLEVLDCARRVAGRDIPFEQVGRRAGDPAAVYADHSKATELLQWTPRYGLQEIVETAWKWHHQHPDGFLGQSQK
jgi:UDP-glucose 4-epimerase